MKLKSAYENPAHKVFGFCYFVSFFLVNNSLLGILTARRSGLAHTSAQVNFSKAKAQGELTQNATKIGDHQEVYFPK